MFLQKSYSVFPLFSLLFIFLLPHFSSAWKTLSPVKGTHDTGCAQVFLRPSFRGPSFQIRDEEQLSDLSSLQLFLNRRKSASQARSGVEEPSREGPISFKIKNGCTLQLSAMKYLKGEVMEFGGDEEELEMDLKSAACECHKECDCEEIKLRQSECGRAYLNDDCSNCKALFTTLKAGNKYDFPEKWATQVQTIVLRRDCFATLHVADLDGETREINITSEGSRVTKNIDEYGMIRKYHCSCSNEPSADDDGGAGDPHDNGEKYPIQLEVPRTKGKINKLIFTEELKYHPGLLASLESLRSGRSSRNAYILLLGLTGSGKSSAVNLIFDHPNITKVGDFVSTTTDILEFTIPVPLPQLGLNNTALHVIDTPGIGDTRGFSHDAQFLATLENFLDKHKDLKRQLPNVVLIFSKFSENRFWGQGSSFVKMLRTIDLFKDRIISTKSTNVIFVLTHYMSETKEMTRDPRQRIEKIRKVIENFSTLPRPIHIVLAENKPEEYHLPSINGFWQLPNGEFYPKNLFDQMQRNLVDCEDPIGEAVIRTAFSNSDNFKISGKRYPLVKESDTRAIHYLGVLASLTKPVAGTEVSAELDKAFAEVEPEMKERYPDALGVLQRSLHMKNIIHLSDLPRTSVEIMKLMEDIQVNPMSLFLLDRAFNLTVPDFKKDFVVGSGYSLIHDKTLRRKIFDIGEAQNVPSDIMFRIPEAFEVVVSHQVDNQIHVFNNKREFIKKRMVALGLSEDVIPAESYKSDPSDHPGFNLISFDDKLKNQSVSGNGGQGTEWSGLTALVDYHLFQIALSKDANFTAEFQNALTELKPLNMTHGEVVTSWINFFDTYGTHVVAHAFGGGGIRVNVRIDENEDDDVNATFSSNSAKFAVLTEVLGKIVEQLGSELMGRNGAYEPPPGVTYDFIQVGGDRKHFWSYFSDQDEIRNIDKWKESLKYEPIILNSRLRLVPISEVVKEIGENDELSQVIEAAASTLLNASLLYIPVEMRGEGNPDSRDDLEGAMRKSEIESVRKFAEMFRLVSEKNRDMHKQMFTLIANMQAKSDLEEKRFQDRMWELRKEAEERERREQEDQKHREMLELKKEQVENEKQAAERALRMQWEASVRDEEAKQRQALAETQAQNQEAMLKFIEAENQRRAMMIYANSRKEKWWEKALKWVGGATVFGFVANLVG